MADGEWRGCSACCVTLITTVEAHDKGTTLWDELAGGGEGQETSLQLAQFRWHRTKKIWRSKHPVLVVGFSGLQWKCLIFHSSTPSRQGNSCPVFQFWCLFRTLYVLRRLQKKLSNHYFSVYGQNLLALESPYKVILTIGRATVFSKDSWFCSVWDSGGWTSRLFEVIDMQ